MKTTIVMVLYKQKLEQSRTFQTLQNTLFYNPLLEGQFQVIVYDNSPEQQEISKEYAKLFMYKHDARNLGIAEAYNYAWDMARESGSEWLLLLDHDTELTEAYIAAMFSLEGVDREKIAAVVPQVTCEGVMISPVFSRTLQPLREEKPKVGLQERPVMAINSGSLIHMEFLNRIGGVNKEFPLDYLDHWLFYKIYEQGYQVLVMDVTLEHELSVMNYDTVSLGRYKSILASEVHFYKRYETSMLPRYKKQLLLRAMKQLLLVKNKRIAMHTFRQLLAL